MHLRQGPVLLAETKAAATWASRMMHQLGGAVVYSSPAVKTDLGLSGGVAIILPSHRWGILHQVKEIVPGYVLQVTIDTKFKKRIRKIVLW